jgi:hypothetical protein
VAYAYEASCDFGKELCKIIGIDSNMVHTISIKIEAGEPITIDIFGYVIEGILEAADWQEAVKNAVVNVNLKKLE